MIDTITEDIRNALWDKFPPQSTKLGYLASCQYCVSIYTGAAVTGLTYLARSPRPSAGRAMSRALLGTLAFSGAVSLYHDSRENS